MSVIRKLAGHTAIYGLSSIAARMLYFFLTPLYTNSSLISQADYGVVTSIFAAMAMFVVFFTYRMEMAYFRYGSAPLDQDRSFHTSMSSLLISTVILSILLIPLVPGFAELVHYPELSHLLVMAVLILGVDALSEIPMARLRIQGKALKFAAVQGGSILVNLGLNLFFLVGCPAILAQSATSELAVLIKQVYNPEIGIGYIFIANLVASVFKFIVLWPSWRDLKFRIDASHWKKMFSYSGPLVLVGIAFSINETIDRNLLPILGSGSEDENLRQLGIYGANYKLAMIISLFTQAFRYGAEPFFFQQKDRLDSKVLYARVAKYFFLAGTLGFLGIMCYLRLVRYFIGPAYWEGLHVVPVLLLANLFLGLYYNFSVWFKLSEKTMWGALISGGGALLTIALNIWWIPLYGYTGCAVATLLCYLCISTASYLLGQRYNPIPYPILTMSKYLLLAIAFAVVSSLLPGMPLLMDLAVNTGLVGIWIVIVWSREREEIMGILRPEQG